MRTLKRLLLGGLLLSGTLAAPSLASAATNVSCGGIHDVGFSCWHWMNDFYSPTESQIDLYFNGHSRPPRARVGVVQERGTSTQAYVCDSRIDGHDTAIRIDVGHTVLQYRARDGECPHRTISILYPVRKFRATWDGGFHTTQWVAPPRPW